MKRLINITCLLLMSLTAMSQNVADIVYKQDLMKVVQDLKRANERIDSLIKASKPVPPISKCTDAPSISSITKVTTTSLTAKINGKGFERITVSIYDEDSTTLYWTNTFKYNSPENSISYTLQPGKYKLYAKAIECSGVGSRSFTIKGTSPGKPDCPRGPTLLAIRDAAPSAVTFEFDGEDVFRIDYEIRLLGGDVAAVGSVDPIRAIVAITGLKLADGDYQLRIRGNNCNNKVPAEDDTPKGFTIKTNPSGGGGTSPPPVPGNPGSKIPKKLSSGIPENLNIYIEKAPGGGWLLSDSSTLSPDSEYDFWYGINNHIEKRSGPLKNYLWPANTPLEVWKAQPRKTTATLAQWSESGGRYDPNAAQGFNFGDSYPQVIFYFQPADSALVPNKQVPHWMDFTPDVTLPKGQVWVMPIGAIDSPDFLIRKGVTHFSKYEITGKPFEAKLLAEGRVYNEVPKTPEQFSLSRGTGVSNWVPKQGGGRLPIGSQPVGWPGPWNEMYFGELRPGQTEPLTLEEGRDAGRKFTVSMPVVVFENSENNHAVGSQWSFVGGFYETYVPRMEAEWLPKGIKPLIAHNYFTGFGGEGYTLGENLALNRSIFRKPLSQWPGNSLLNGTLAKTTAVCYGYYLGAPDVTRDEAYKFIFASQIAKVAGKEILLFPQEFHEDRPNNFFEARFPDGKFYYRNKKEYTPTEMTNMAFLAQLFGKGTIPFGASPKTTSDFRWQRQWHQNHGYLWKPNGGSYQSDQTFPYWTDGGENSPNMTFEYSLSEGVRIYCQTFAQVKGGKSQFLRYRMDGGDWITVQNEYMDDVVNAYQAKKPIVYSETLNGKTAVMYLWPYADTILHTVEYELNGQVFSRTVHSNMIHTYMHQ